ncbi:MAG TPA: hypothetical protein VLZ81_00130, partial [Blastocatellia bacterium]|nr:hypothetical protein [Blastocatellia bacterium]
NPQDFPNMAPTNLAAALQPTSSVVKSVAGSIDLFSFWLIILLSIGFVAICGGKKKISTGKAAALVILPWFVWVVIKAGFASLGFGG